MEKIIQDLANHYDAIFYYIELNRRNRPSIFCPPNVDREMIEGELNGVDADYLFYNPLNRCRYCRNLATDFMWTYTVEGAGCCQKCLQERLYKVRDIIINYPDLHGEIKVVYPEC